MSRHRANRHLAVLSRIAALVAIGDLLTKTAAANWIGANSASLDGWIHFSVVQNQQAAFGWSFGTYTWQLNLALTLATVAFVVPVSRELALIDRAAPRALGLIVGGALGNFVSLVLSPHGVVDFIAVNAGGNSELVLNVADVAAYVGLVMMVRTGFLIVGAMRRDSKPAVRTPVVRPRQRLLVQSGEREVNMPLYREPVAVVDRPMPAHLREEAWLADLGNAKLSKFNTESRRAAPRSDDSSPRWAD